MCSRYHVDSETMSDIQRLADEISGNLSSQVKRDIYPSNQSFVLCADPRGRSRIRAEEMRWGFPSFDKKLMINARAEMALEKRSFSDSVRRRRCIIPCSHFYEWDAARTKTVIAYPESPSVYLAGFYNIFREEKHFIVLTTAANASMQKIHDRMPLIFDEEQIRDWIFREDMVQEFLQKQSPMVSTYQDYEQMTLF